MDIYEFMNMPSRGAKVTQLVKHWDEVPESKKTKYPMIGMVKKDGVHAIVVNHPSKGCKIFSRTGNELTNLHMIAERFSMLCPHGVFHGEICNSLVSLEQLSGIVNPNRTKPLLKEQQDTLYAIEFFAFDYTTASEFKAGIGKADYEMRWSVLRDKIGDLTHIIGYSLLNSEQEVMEYADRHIALGEEGVVIRQGGEVWEAGHKGFKAMKIVRGVSYDLRCIGYEEGKGKYAGKIANLIFEWKDGETIKCMLGKGWTHRDAEQMFNVIDDIGDYRNPIGKIFEVYALQESSKGKLRLPKVGSLRFDKETSDVEQCGGTITSTGS